MVMGDSSQTMVGLEGMMVHLSRNQNLKKRVKSRNSLATSLQMLRYIESPICRTWCVLQIRCTQPHLPPRSLAICSVEHRGHWLQSSSVDSPPHPPQAGLQPSLHHLPIKGSSIPLALQPGAFRPQRLCLFPSGLGWNAAHWTRLRLSQSCLEGLSDNTQEGGQTCDKGREPSVFICQTAPASILYPLLSPYLLPWLTFLFPSLLPPWDHPLGRQEHFLEDLGESIWHLELTPGRNKREGKTPNLTWNEQQMGRFDGI